MNTLEVGCPFRVRSVRLRSGSDGPAISRGSDLAVLYLVEEAEEDSELITSFPLGRTCCVIPSSSDSNKVEDWLTRRLLSRSKLSLRRVPRRSVSAECS